MGTNLSTVEGGPKALIEKMGPALTEVLPSLGVTPERFMKMLIMALRKDEKFAKCSLESIMESAMQAALLGLEPNTPLKHAYLIPYGNECQFQTDYRGEIELVKRSGVVVDVYAEVVREGDAFDEEKGLNRTFTHKPAENNYDKPIIKAYAVAVYANGSKTYATIHQGDVDKILKIAKKGKAGDIWKTWPEPMWCKTAIRKLCKFLSKSVVDDRFREYMEKDSPFNQPQTPPKLLEAGSFNFKDKPAEEPVTVEDLENEVDDI